MGGASQVWVLTTKKGMDLTLTWNHQSSAVITYAAGGTMLACGYTIVCYPQTTWSEYTSNEESLDARTGGCSATTATSLES